MRAFITCTKTSITERDKRVQNSLVLRVDTPTNPEFCYREGGKVYSLSGQVK